MIRLVIVEDNPMVRAGLRAVLGLDDGIEVVGEAANGWAGLETVERERPDITLLDHRMPLADGLEVLGRIAALTKVLMLTSDGSTDVVRRALTGGARGFIAHDELEPDDLVRAVRTVADGRSWLSPTAATVAMNLAASPNQNGAADPGEETVRRLRHRAGLTRRERQMMQLLVEGLSNTEIAQVLALAEKTVKNHLNHVYAKLGVTSRGQAVAVWSGRVT